MVLPLLQGDRPGAALDAVPRASRLHYAGLLLGLLGLAALAGVVLHLGDVERFAALLRALAPAWLLLALLLQSGTYVSIAASWRTGLRHAGTRHTLRDLLPLALAKLFVDQSVPTGGFSGSAFLVAALARRGVPRPTCIAALIVNLLGYYAAYLLAGLIGITLLWLRHELRTWMLVIAAASTLVALATPGAVWWLHKYGRRELDWLRRLPGVHSLLEAATEAPVDLRHHPRALLATTALNFAVIVLDAATLWTMLHALGLGTPYAVVFPSFLLAMMITTVGAIPLGLGTFEATCVAALTLQGVPIEGALAATLLLRGCTTWLPMLPGLLLARRELREAPASQNGRAPSP